MPPLPQPDGINKVNYESGYNDDIMHVLERNFPRAKEEVKNFYKEFQGATLEDTARNVWKYMKKHIDYKADGDIQEIRLPARLIHDGTGDCKSYSLLGAAIMSYYAPVAFRYVAYRGDTPTHVYCIVKKPNGSIIILDGVWDFFNSEKKPIAYKTDHWMKIMTLSGHDEPRHIVVSPEQQKNIVEEVLLTIKLANRQRPRSNERRLLHRHAMRRYNCLYGNEGQEMGALSLQDLVKKLEALFKHQKTTQPGTAAHAAANQQIVNTAKMMGIGAYTVTPVTSTDFANLQLFVNEDNNPAMFIAAYDPNNVPTIYQFVDPATTLAVLGKPQSAFPGLPRKTFQGYPLANANVITPAYAQYIQQQHGLATAAVKASHSLSNKLKNIWHDIKHVAAAPGRDAFLGLVDLNAFDLATHLAAANQKNGGVDLHNLWTNTLGGNYSILNNSIETGAKKKPLLGIRAVLQTTGIGFVIAGAAVAAAPIIAAVVALLKQLGIIDAKTAADITNTAATAFAAATGEPMPALLDANGNPIPGVGITDKGSGIDHSHTGASVGFSLDTFSSISPGLKRGIEIAAFGGAALAGWHWIVKPMLHK